MKGYQFHRKWVLKYPLPLIAFDFTYSLIDEPVKQADYLKYLTNVTDWWDEKDIEFVSSQIQKDCKTAADRIKAKQKYEKYLSDHLRGIKAGDKAGGLPEFQRKHLPKKAAERTMFQNIFFNERKTGRDISREKEIGYFNSHMQQKYTQPKGSQYLLAWYLHHLIDYCNENYETFPSIEILKRNRERIKPIYPKSYDEVADFIYQHFEELKHDFETD